MSVVDGDGPAGRSAWTAGQVARHLRIAESTLRSWHRRYGVGPQASRPGSYRRYTAEDVERLRHMRDLISAGMLPSEAAGTISTPVPRPLEEALDEVLAAARDLDNSRCLATIEHSLAARGVVEVWERLCRPAMLAIDADQRADSDCVDREHVLSWAIAAALHRVDRPAADGPRTLLACTEAEQHTLPLEALAAALAERRQTVRMLGAAVPTPTLVHAVAAARPDAVVLWAQSPATARPEAVRALGVFPLRRVTAGPGWPRRRLSGTERFSSLTGAVAALTAPTQ
ncbi:MAG: MerR family transcriptional regulator [Actinophytocola sp.]|uniref:MerR family transcriptional regulator n=1 Tax=Actinophytocola sp. TaxID=1872138 RepID=UPI003D6B6E7D